MGSEETIIKELVANGPILFDFNADKRFQIYKSGVLDTDYVLSAQLLDEDEWNLM